MRLTKDEIRLIAVIVLALTTGAAVKHYRRAHPVPVVAAPATPKPFESEPAGY